MTNDPTWADSLRSKYGIAQPVAEPTPFDVFLETLEATRSSSLAEFLAATPQMMAHIAIGAHT